jgi:hypothetical protein
MRRHVWMGRYRPIKWIWDNPSGRAWTGFICTTSACGDEPRPILKIIKRFGKHCSCYLQGEYVMVGRSWQPYMFPETLDNLQLSTRLIPESLSCTLNSSRENLRRWINLALHRDQWLVDSSEHRNETSGFIKWREIFWLAELLLAS